MSARVTLILECAKFLAFYIIVLSWLVPLIRLLRYADIFVRHEIDLPTFATLTDEELKEIGIPTFGARKKLLLLARETKKKLGSA